MRTAQKDTKPVLAQEAKKVHGQGQALKIERALEIRKSSAKAREGKPLAFPTQRHRP